MWAKQRKQRKLRDIGIGSLEAAGDFLVQDGVQHVRVMVERVAARDRRNHDRLLNERVQAEAKRELGDGREGQVEDDAILGKGRAVDLLEEAGGVRGGTGAIWLSIWLRRRSGGRGRGRVAGRR